MEDKKMSLTIRPARPSDLPQVHDIYTHYVLNTSLTFLTNAPPLSFTVKKFEDITLKRKLPFLVAVREANELGVGGEEEEEILGYASLSPYRGTLLAYAPTVELSLFLHPEQTGKGIGGRLLGELLGMVRRGEVWHDAREFEGVEGWERGLGEAGNGDGDRMGRVRNVLAVMAVDVERREEGEGLRRWYVERGFVERGRMEGVGFKRGRWIDTVYLQYRV
ncbi:hypothetical protein FQN54_006833 [Arachnomyces sp. PD_36]|nr:hypothetical protein FQN54_006833 [Arachnomyces sp. PD_36]